jgi:hypothetical protein
VKEKEPMALSATKTQAVFDGRTTDLNAPPTGVTSHQAYATGAGRRPRPRTPSRLFAFFAAAVTVVALSACGQSDSKTYDISPIFPLSSDKCARYDGKTEGTGITAHCWVTKDKCVQAVTDWRQAMRQSGVTDAIQFSCT